MKKWYVGASKFLLVIMFILLLSAYLILRGSLPQLDGVVTGQTDYPVTLTRDEQGVATIIAQSRSDLSFALGYVHAQERFFQMDLLRRNSAGELSELFGPVAFEQDKRIRHHQFRKRATRYFNNLPKDQLNVLYSYTAGVNLGLETLSLKPFEYWLLNKPTVAWRPEDSLLVLYSMYLDLQHENGERERTLGQLKNNLMADVYQFLTPKGSRWDAAIDGTAYQASQIPQNNFELAPMLSELTKLESLPEFSLFANSHEASVGSNNWAVAGAISTTGSAIVADDMHLGIRVPNIWYRASFRYQHQEQKVRVDGVTLPGTPAMVAGSNHNMAWGFTNSYGDWNDVIRLKLDETGEKYLTPDGYKAFGQETEIVLVSEQPAKKVDIKTTIWGPVIGRDQDGRLIALRWVAHDPQGVNFNMLGFELANTVEDAIVVANNSGIPAQNVVMGDRQGNIGWTIAGAIPKKFGFQHHDAEGWAIPQDWSRGDKGWSGYLEIERYPKVVNPENNRIWTANSRVVGGDNLEKIGNGGYALGARSQQIRDNLMAKSTFDEQALFAIQNDDRALFLTRWQQLLLDDVLDYDFIQSHKLAPLVLHLQNWQQRASIDSVGYLFVRQFRLNLRDLLFSPLEQTIQAQSVLSETRFSLRPIRHQLEVPLWEMVSQSPEHLLPKGYDNWKALLQDMVLTTQEELVEEYGSLNEATWGAHNHLAIQHPLSKAIPGLGWLLDMPSEPANGDTYMPRVQGRAFGASQRMVVSPGFEHRAIMQMPSSQSGHPLSPFYGKGHDDWVKGIATPLLPGKVEYQLSIVPQ